MDYNFEKFKNQAMQLKITLTDEIRDKLLIYYKTLIEYNQVMNLTAITEFDEVLEKHFLDSIVLADYIDLNRRIKLVDVGTGAGFPGIPLKIFFPDLNILLVDSLNKRVNFLNEVILRLELKNIIAVHGRAEELARKKEYRNQFDLCVSRAVANLSCLSEYCIPFVRKGGIFASYKSIDIDEEIDNSKNAICMLGGKLKSVNKFQLPDTEYYRSIVMIENVEEHTSKKYPRKAGMPNKQPLK